MSAKQSLDFSNWVRLEIASQPSLNRGKTLKPRSEKPEYSWKRLYSKRLDKVINFPESREKGCDAKDRVVTRVNIKVAS
jgi:hypothetical protein